MGQSKWVTNKNGKNAVYFSQKRVKHTQTKKKNIYIYNCVEKPRNKAKKILSKTMEHKKNNPMRHLTSSQH